MTVEIAKSKLDKIIDKARAHLYKPIQIAEILYHHRNGLIENLMDLESYRSQSLPANFQCNMHRTLNADKNFLVICG